MKKIFFLILIMFGLSSYAQEPNSEAVGTIPEFQQVVLVSAEDLFIGTWEMQRPSLSMPVVQFPENRFTIREVDFSKKVEKRQVNLVAMMEKERYEKQQASVELESPMPDVGKGEKALIEVTNQIRMHDRSSNFDIYTGEKKIPAYQDMHTPLFRRGYSPNSGRGFVTPAGYYSPYLR